jgi:starch-binding outer membrane protein, SusD/RagB family
MKKITYISLLVLVTIWSSCEKILDQSPLTQPSLDNFYRNEAEAVLAINAIYQILATSTVYNRGQIALAMMEDHTHQNVLGEMVQINQLNFQPDNSIIFGWYRGCYIGIGRANFAIDRIPKIDSKNINAATRKRLVAEAKFLRGLFYYHLVRLFGEVPTIITPTEDVEVQGVAKSPEADVWKLIEKDFSEAIPDLPAAYAATDRGRATSWAAKAFLAQVYQWQKKNREALAVVNEIVASRAFSLHANYVDNFREATENGVESIFAVQFRDLGTTSGNQTASWVRDVGIRGTNPINAATSQAGFGYLLASAAKLADYETGDIRRDVTMWENGKISPATNRAINMAAPDVLARAAADVGPMKWWWNDQGYQGRGENLDLIRYADVLLMQAELINEEQGPNLAAYAAINAVRTRAKLPNLKADLTKEAFFTAVLKERHVELMFEFQRWWDLARTKTAGIYYLNAVGKSTFNPAKHYKWPLPGIALERNKALVQNPAYR